MLFSVMAGTSRLGPILTGVQTHTSTALGKLWWASMDHLMKLDLSVSWDNWDNSEDIPQLFLG